METTGQKHVLVMPLHRIVVIIGCLLGLDRNRDYPGYLRNHVSDDNEK